MGDHFALLVNRLITESTIHAVIASTNQTLKQVEQEQEQYKDIEFLVVKDGDNGDLSSPRKVVECRICQDEDFDSNMETPCACCGSLKYAHRRCVQRWCNEKGNTICEICHQSFRPGYSAPPPLFHYQQLPVTFRRTWQINRRELVESQLMRGVSTDDQDLLSPDSEEPSSRSSICRFIVAVIFIGLLVLRHTLPIIVGGAHELVLLQFLLAILRIVGILLLVYVTMISVTGLRRHRNVHTLQESPSNTSDTSSVEENEHLDSQQASHVIQISL